MKKNVKDYLRDDQTRRFLLRDVSVAGRENFSRQDALNQVFQPKTMTVWMQGVRNSAYDHILSRSFESLRNLHEQYFRRPSQYSVSRIWDFFTAALIWVVSTTVKAMVWSNGPPHLTLSRNYVDLIRLDLISPRYIKGYASPCSLILINLFSCSFPGVFVALQSHGARQIPRSRERGVVQ